MALYNFIIINEKKLLSNNTYTHMTPKDRNIISEGLSSLPINEDRSFVNSGIKVRNAYSKHFMSTSALSFQWEKAMNNDFNLFD